MKKGRVKALVDGYIFLEIAGRIFIEKIKQLSEDEIQIVKFRSSDRNFEFEDLTVTDDIEEKKITAMILSSRVTKTDDGFKTNCILDVF